MAFCLYIQAIMMVPRFKSFTWRSELTAGPRLIKAGDLRRSLTPGTRRVVHEHWVLDYCVEDSGKTRIGAKGHPWLRRMGLTAHLYPPKTFYWERTDARRLNHSLYIGFLDGEAAGLTELIDPNLDGGRFVDPERQLLNHLVQCVEIGETLGQQGFWRAQAVFLRIIGALRHSRMSTDGLREIGSGGSTAGQSDFVRLVRDVLRRNSGRKTTLSEIAASVNVSVSTLTHRYRRETGRSPMREHAELRTERAKELLALGESLQTIADALEFADVYHLSKAFKRITGITPSAFKSGDACLIHH